MGSHLSTPKCVFVIGASGNVGKATLEEVIKQKSASTTVVAGVRDPAKLSSVTGAKVVAASQGTPELAGVLKAEGADCAIIITPGTEDRADLAAAGVKSCAEAGVKHVVVVSVTTADVQDTIFGKQFTKLETAVKTSGVHYTIVRLPMFVENHMGFIAPIKGEGKIYCPCDPTKKFTALAVADIAAFLAHSALHPKKNKTYSIGTKPASYQEISDALGKAIGKPVEYVRVPYDAAKQSFLSSGWPEWQTDGLLELFKLVDEGKCIFPGAEKSFHSVVGRDPMTVEQWCENYKGAFM